MQIVKTDHKSGKGIYAISATVKPKNHIVQLDEMVEWFDENNGHFKGEHEQAYAIAHCQVEENDPIKLFVVTEVLNAPQAPLEGKKGDKTRTNTFFEARGIFNAEILETPEKVEREIPKRDIKKAKDGKVEVTVSLEKKKFDNLIKVPEGCMSFSHRKQKNTMRYHTVKVRYQYLKKGVLGMSVKTFEGWVEGLKAHILQHECDHFNGKNIYHND